jgi:hypothetical protein
MNSEAKVLRCMPQRRLQVANQSRRLALPFRVCGEYDCL